MPPDQPDHVAAAEACAENARNLLRKAETSPADEPIAALRSSEAQAWATLALGHRVANATAVIGGALGAEVASAIERSATIVDEGACR